MIEKTATLTHYEVSMVRMLTTMTHHASDCYETRTTMTHSTERRLPVISGGPIPLDVMGSGDLPKRSHPDQHPGETPAHGGCIERPQCSQT